MMDQTTQGLASLGRNGDTMLMHVNPDELRGLLGLAMSHGGSLSINPHTGLPEAFSLRNMFKSFLPMLAGMAMPASAPLWAGIAAGAGVGALTNKNKLLGAVTGVFGRYSGVGLGNALRASAMPAATAGAAGGGYSGLATGGGYIPGATSAADVAYNSAMLGPTAGSVNTGLSNVGSSMMTDPSIVNAQNAAKASGFANSAATGATGVDKSFLQGLGDKLSTNVNDVSSGVSNIATGKEGAWDAFKGSFTDKGQPLISDLSAYGKIALPVAGAALGGLEESDIYGKPFDMASAKEKEKYDPYSQLNLNQDTGLRLVAKGGLINSYAIGGPIEATSGSSVYGNPDGTIAQQTPKDDYGIGRLNNLASAQSINQASLTGYAEGGELKLEDKFSTAFDEAPVITPEQAILTEAAKTQTPENDMSKLGITGLGVGNIPTNNFAPGSLATIANAMKNQNVPPEAAFVQNLTGARTGYAMGGLTALKPGGYLSGGGDGMSDSIPATIDGKQQARLADGEFVIPADVVSHIGNGSSKAGSKRLYAMLDKVRKARTGHTKQGKQINPNQYLPA